MLICSCFLHTLALKKVDQSMISNNVVSTTSRPYVSIVHQLVRTWFVILAKKLCSCCCWRCNWFACNLTRLDGVWKKALLLFFSAKHFRIFSSRILTRNLVLHRPRHFKLNWSANDDSVVGTCCRSRWSHIIFVDHFQLCNRNAWLKNAAALECTA